ncbi:MAG: glycosyltransferase family 2 protein [Thermoleophilia bacterium]
MTTEAPPSVCTILLNYNASIEMMSKCLDSLVRQTYGNHHVLLVDNASSKDILPEITRSYPLVEILRLDQNHGFSGGINRGVAATDADYVCILNFDTVVEPDFISEMVEVIQTDADIVGVAPKMLISDKPHIFDSIGIAMADNAGAFNQAIGQPDIGQYDFSERVFGACFGAALLRREAFDPARVGPLDETYFMYFEDVDWCFRANLLGGKFYTAPRAVVYHEHSSSVKDMGYQFKYKLIETNLLRTVVKNYQRRLAVKIAATRLKSHLQSVLHRRSPHSVVNASVSLAIIAGFLLDLSSLLPRRWEIQRRRVVRDHDLLVLAHGEAPYYDPIGYRPFYTLGTLIAAYDRLYSYTGEEEAYRIKMGLEAMNRSKLKLEPGLLKKRLGDILAGQPQHVLDFAAEIVATKQA